MKNISLILLVFVVVVLACGEQVKPSEESKESEPKQIESIVEKKIVEETEQKAKKKESKWDKLIDRKGPQGDTIGWYLSNRGAWIDTMREEKHKYNPWPPSDMGKTYYPNFTLYLPQNKEKIEQIEREIRVYTKTLKQEPVKWIYPLKDSELFGKESIKIQKINESSYGYQSANIDIQGHSHLKSSYPEAQDQMVISIKQVGDVLISELNHYKIKNYADLVFAKTEITIYDLNGNILGKTIRDGVGGNLSVSKNLKYLFQMYGGQFTEDTKLPSRASIYDLEEGVYYWEKESLEDCIKASVREDSNIGAISVTYDCDIFSKKNKYIVVDLENGVFLEFISLNKCEIARIGRNNSGEVFYTDQTGKRIPLSWKKDFKEIKNLP